MHVIPEYDCETVEGLDKNRDFAPGGRGVATIGLIDTVVVALGGIGTAIGVVQAVIAAPWILALVAKVGPAASGLALAGVGWAMWFKVCGENPEGSHPCMAGIVDRVVPADHQSTVAEVFGFTRMHDLVEIVVKCKYWPTLKEGAGWIYYNQGVHQGDVIEVDPIVKAYIHDPQVCRAALGSAIGATVGGVVGGVAALAVDQAVLAVCAALGPMGFLCYVLAAIVAAVVAIASAIGGSAAGTYIGTTESSGGTPPPLDDSINLTSQNGGAFTVGQYVAVKGNLFSSGLNMGANVFWFVESWTSYLLPPPALPHRHTTADRHMTEWSDEQQKWMHLEDSFCDPLTDDGDVLGGASCIDLSEIPKYPESPTTLGHGWVVSTESGDAMSVALWGPPAGQLKLFLGPDPVRVDFGVPVVRAWAEVAWGGGSAIAMTGVRGTVEVGTALAPRTRDTIHTLSISAPEIDAVIFVAQEGALIRLCVER